MFGSTALILLQLSAQGRAPFPLLPAHALLTAEGAPSQPQEFSAMLSHLMPDFPQQPKTWSGKDGHCPFQEVAQQLLLKPNSLQVEVKHDYQNNSISLKFDPRTSPTCMQWTSQQKHTTSLPQQSIAVTTAVSWLATTSEAVTTSAAIHQQPPQPSAVHLKLCFLWYNGLLQRATIQPSKFLIVNMLQGSTALYLMSQLRIK